MILYLDTSSLVKLYLDEIHSEAVHRWAQEAEVLATSRVAYPETFAALARRWREGDFDEMKCLAYEASSHPATCCANVSRA